MSLVAHHNKNNNNNNSNTNTIHYIYKHNGLGFRTKTKDIRSNINKMIIYLDNDVSQAELATPRLALMNECFEPLELLNTADIDIINTSMNVRVV